MNEFEIKRTIEMLKVTRDFLISNNLNTSEHERRYEKLIEILTSRLYLFESQSN